MSKLPEPAAARTTRERSPVTSHASRVYEIRPIETSVRCCPGKVAA